MKTTLGVRVGPGRDRHRYAVSVWVLDEHGTPMSRVGDEMQLRPGDTFKLPNEVTLHLTPAPAGEVS